MYTKMFILAFFIIVFKKSNNENNEEKYEASIQNENRLSHIIFIHSLRKNDYKNDIFSVI